MSRDTTLYTADIALEHLLKKLSTLTSSIGVKIFDSVRLRINERRLESLSSLVYFINQPNNYPPKKGFLKYSTKSELYEVATNLLKRLYPDNTETEHEPINVGPVEPSTNYREQLKAALTVANSPKPHNKQPTVSKNIKRDFQNYENLGLKTENIKRLIQICQSIRPTSTEPERTFSTSGNFVTKLRSRLADTAVNALVFLKYHFKRTD